MISVDLIEAGNAAHSDIDRLMIGLQEQRIDDKIPDTLIFVEHPEIVTIGRRGMLDGLEAPDGFASSNVDRGGGITWHGPGQLVGYPVFKWQEESIRKVITMIEEWIIISLDKLGIKVVRNEAMHRSSKNALLWAKWPMCVEKTSANLAIHNIPNYVHVLASDFNQFYRDCPVIKDENENFRINLVNCSQKILRQSLAILGITAPDRM